MVTHGIVLGHVVSVEEVEVEKSKINLIANLPPLKTIKDVRSFLGHARFYRSFIKHFSLISVPMLIFYVRMYHFIGMMLVN